MSANRPPAQKPCMREIKEKEDKHVHFKENLEHPSPDRAIDPEGSLQRPSIAIQGVIENQQAPGIIPRRRLKVNIPTWVKPQPEKPIPAKPYESSLNRLLKGMKK